MGFVNIVHIIRQTLRATLDHDSLVKKTIGNLVTEPSCKHLSTFNTSHAELPFILKNVEPL